MIAGVYTNVINIHQTSLISRDFALPCYTIRGLPVLRVQPCRDRRGATLPADAGNTAGTGADDEGNVTLGTTLEVSMNVPNSHWLVVWNIVHFPISLETSQAPDSFDQKDIEKCRCPFHHGGTP